MATGDTLAEFAAVQTGFPPGTNTARFDRTTTTKAPVVKFDDTTRETFYYSGYMIGQYDGTSAINVVLGWKFLTFVGSQTCDWEVAFARIQDDTNSIDSVTFETAQAVLATEASATGEVDYATVAFTNAQADGIQPNEFFYLRVERDPTGGTASPGDAQLAFVAADEG